MPSLKRHEETSVIPAKKSRAWEMTEEERQMFLDCAQERRAITALLNALQDKIEKLWKTVKKRRSIPEETMLQADTEGKMFREI